jgi:hypothetical protein
VAHRSGAPPEARDADEGAAERRLLEALELARAQRARSLELRAAASLFRLRTKHGRASARSQAAVVGRVELVHGRRETADLQQAAALLRVEPAKLMRELSRGVLP